MIQVQGHNNCLHNLTIYNFNNLSPDLEIYTLSQLFNPEHKTNKTVFSDHALHVTFSLIC